MSNRVMQAFSLSLELVQRLQDPSLIQLMAEEVESVGPLDACGLTPKNYEHLARLAHVGLSGRALLTYLLNNDREVWKEYESLRRSNRQTARLARSAQRPNVSRIVEKLLWKALETVQADAPTVKSGGRTRRNARKAA